MAEVELPTRNEIAQLPRRAIVALAARCARRVQPLFAEFWPYETSHHQIAVENAISFSEIFATTGVSKPFGDPFAAAAEAAAYAASDAKVYAAACAAEAAAYSAYAACVSDAANAAAKAAKSAKAATPTPMMLSSIREDFARLLEASRRQNWDDTTPVPPSFFEPLGANLHGLKTADPVEPDEIVAMVLQALGEPGVDASTLAKHLLAMYKSLNQYTLAKYGRHLSRGQFRRLVLQHTGVPA